MTVNSTRMELCFKSCLEARPGSSVLKEPEQLMVLISPTKDNSASRLPSFSFSIPKIINLLLQVYQENTTMAPQPSKTTQHQSSLSCSLA